MEEILVNIDSKYRDITVYPQESKYSITFEKKYKNIISVRMLSLEITNTINYISNVKNNNYFTHNIQNVFCEEFVLFIIICKNISFYKI